jgi:polysaccharide deacetylase family protein (PEP-CTERM system associated)
MTQQIRNYLTIDVEDYFQVSAFDRNIPIESWGDYESRVANNTKSILSLLAQQNTRATFFIVGWIAERFPQLVTTIRNAGHEIGCHSYLHRRVYTLSPAEFKEDTAKAKQILEDTIGEAILGYRAPSYSITNKSLWALDILEELGFTYDSSIFPVYHDNYGIPDSPRFEYIHSGRKLKEYPISTVRYLRNNIPVSGGGYFRVFPYWFSRKMLSRINEVEGKPFMFYLHPWEIDPGQPRIRNASVISRFRHYNNLKKTKARFAKLLCDFSFGAITGH